MQISKYRIRLFKHHAHQIGINRGALIVVLCGLLCLMGTAAFFVDAASPILGPTLYSHTSSGNNTLPSTSANEQAARRYIHPVLHPTSQTAPTPFDFPVYYGNTHLP